MKARISILVCCALMSLLSFGGAASAGKVAVLVRKAAQVLKMAKKADKVVDGAEAVKDGRKIYRALDVLADGVRIGKGMLGKLADSVSDDIVRQCAKIVREKGAGSLDDVGKILAKQFNNPALTARERDLLLNDAYLRIAKEAGKISAGEADDAFRLLRDTEGLHALVRKCCSMNASQAAGHLYEFRQAIAFQKSGFNVLGVGVKYSDGVKSNVTDLDLLVQRGKKIFLVESKHYTHGTGDPITIRGDAQSLVQLKDYLVGEIGSSVDVTPIFTFVAKPAPLLAKQLEAKGIPYFVGESDELVEVLSALL